MALVSRHGRFLTSTPKVVVYLFFCLSLLVASPVSLLVFVRHAPADDVHTAVVRSPLLCYICRRLTTTADSGNPNGVAVSMILGDADADVLTFFNLAHFP